LLQSLEDRKLIIWDRYVDSAIAYRAAEFVIKPDLVDLEFVKIINKPFMAPDITIYIDIDADTAIKRGVTSGKHCPYDKGFLTLVRKEYRKIGGEKGYIIVEGNQPIDDVRSDIEQIIRSSFKELFDES
jgi:dTMP kinase